MNLSIVVATNKQTYWKRFCEALAKNNAEFEVIFVGPVGDGINNLPVATKFIDVPEKEIGAVQCWEIGARAAKGELLGLVTDDCVFTPGVLDAVVIAASKCKNRFDMFSARYIHNGEEQLYAHRMWCQADMPFLPIGGFTFTETHHYMSGLDSRFHGCFWDSDLYMHQYQMGGRTTLLNDYSYSEQNEKHDLFTKYASRDGEVLNMLWPAPRVANMQRALARIPFPDYVPVEAEGYAYG